MTDAARLVLGDCIEAMQSMEPESVHAIVCDPPYEIGFNGNEWDKQGIAFDPVTWQTAGAVLKPGGYLLAFASARLYHRMAVAIEDGGLAVVDQFQWIYASSAPHAIDVTLMLDRRAGVEREVVGEGVGVDTSVTRPGFSGKAHSKVANRSHVYPVSVPTSEIAKNWDGWSTRLKPAHEPICVARKPHRGAIADNLIEHGVGAMNIDACRIGDEGGIRHGKEADIGRWPSNVAFGHSPDCAGYGAAAVALCAPGCAVRVLSEQQANAPSFFYIAKPRRRERIGGTLRNLHQTVKPIDFMRWLVRLVTPPDGIVLDPFLGSGTTGCAAMVEGFRFVGVEKDPESFETASARVADYAFAHGRPKPVVVSAEDVSPPAA